MNTWLVVSMVALWCVVLALAIMNIVLFRQLGIFVMGSARGVEASGIPLGKKLPQQRLQTAAGGEWSPADWAGSPFLVFAGGTYCSECASLMPVLRELDQAGVRLVVFLFFDKRDKLDEYLREHEVPGTVIPTSQELGHTYDFAAVPFAYAVDERGAVVMKGLAGNRPRLAEYAAKCGVEIPAVEPSREPAAAGVD